MTDEEIRTSYRDAKYPKQQIKILCELTLKSKEEICRIIGEGHETGRKRQTGRSACWGRMKKPRMTDEETAAIDRLWAQWLSAYKIGVEIGRAKETVASYIARTYGGVRPSERV